PDGTEINTHIKAPVKASAAEDVVIVKGPDGKPIYLPKSKASGQTPYEKPEATPNELQIYDRIAQEAIAAGEKPPALKEWVADYRKTGQQQVNIGDNGVK